MAGLWLPHQHPNHCRDVHEYFAEITAAIALIDNAHPGAFLLLAGHSTGGLTTSLYLHEGEKTAAGQRPVAQQPLL